MYVFIFLLLFTELFSFTVEEQEKRNTQIFELSLVMTMIMTSKFYVYPLKRETVFWHFIPYFTATVILYSGPSAIQQPIIICFLILCVFLLSWNHIYYWMKKCLNIQCAISIPFFLLLHCDICLTFPSTEFYRNETLMEKSYKIPAVVSAICYVQSKF